MWIKKRENETLKYKCSSRWTSDRKSAAMENRPANDPGGVVMYNKCLGWARDLKNMKETKDYADLQVECNKKCVELGFIKALAGSDEDDEGTQERVSRVDRSSVVEAPYFTLDECDKIPVYEV